MGRATRAEIVAMDRAMRQATLDHGEAIERILTDSIPELPKLAQRLVRLSAKKVTFRGSQSIGDLRNAFFILVALDQWKFAYPIALRLATIPKYMTAVLIPLVAMVHRANWYAHQIEDHEAIDSLGPDLFQPENYKPTLDEQLLKRPLDDARLRAHLDLDPTDKSDVYTPIGRPQYFVIDLTQLSILWGYGGNEEWPRERIEVERERLETALRAIPGMH